MKRFSWRLERVLEITARREQALRAELFALAQEIARTRHEIALRRQTVRTILDDLGRKTLAERLGEQTIVLACAAAEERILAGLQRRCETLEAERKTKTEQFMKHRTLRRSLERLREAAYAKYLRAAAAREQAEFDEVSHIAFARRLGGTRRGWHDSDRTGAARVTAAAR
jgi:hypothetical protein